MLVQQGRGCGRVVGNTRTVCASVVCFQIVRNPWAPIIATKYAFRLSNAYHVCCMTCVTLHTHAHKCRSKTAAIAKVMSISQPRTCSRKSVRTNTGRALARRCGATMIFVANVGQLSLGLRVPRMIFGSLGNRGLSRINQLLQIVLGARGEGV